MRQDDALVASNEQPDLVTAPAVLDYLSRQGQLESLATLRHALVHPVHVVLDGGAPRVLGLTQRRGWGL